MNSEAKKESEYWKLNEEEESFYHLLYLPRGIERLEQLGEVEQVPAGQEMNKLGEIPQCCYLVKSGRVIDVYKRQIRPIQRPPKSREYLPRDSAPVRFH